MGEDSVRQTAILVLFLSDHKENKQEEKYYYDNGRGAETGIQTNDAPTKYLLRAAHDNGNEIGDIFCITSRRVYEERIGNSERTAIDEYREMLEEFCRAENLSIPKIISIEYDFERRDGETRTVDDESRAMHIYRQITGELERRANTDQTDVYIDYTGGLRDVSFLMTTIVRYLEFDNIKCRKIVYSKYDYSADHAHRIYDIAYIYNMFQMINGVSEFVATGNARQLSAVYSGQKMQIGKEDEESGKIQREFLDSIMAFSNALSLCNIKAIDQTKDAISRNIGKIMALDTAGAGDGEDPLKEEMLRTLIPLVRKKMYLDRPEGLSYPNLIRWCVDNRLLQQAITIYIEKIPVYCMQQGMLPDFVLEVNVEDKRGASEETTRFYTALYDCIAEGIELHRFRTVLENRLSGRRTTQEMTDILRGLERDPQVGGAARRLLQFVERFGRDRNRQKIYKCDVREYSGEDFLRKLVSEPYRRKRDLHYFVYNDEQRYKSIPRTTYLKKVHALTVLKDNKSIREQVGDADRLLEIMKYYLAIKMIRNRMNHASEEEDSDDERQAAEALEGFGIVINSDIGNIQNIMYEALAAVL